MNVVINVELFILHVYVCLNGCQSLWWNILLIEPWTRYCCMSAWARNTKHLYYVYKCSQSMWHIDVLWCCVCYVYLCVCVNICVCVVYSMGKKRTWERSAAGYNSYYYCYCYRCFLSVDFYSIAYINMSYFSTNYDPNINSNQLCM